MAAQRVVLLLPIRDDHPCMGQGSEVGDVQALILDLAVEGLRQGAPAGMWGIPETSPAD